MCVRVRVCKYHCATTVQSPSSSYQGEVEVEPVIEEEPKLVWSAPPDFESFKKELEELRETVHEKVRRKEGSEVLGGFVHWLISHVVYQALSAVLF